MGFGPVAVLWSAALVQHCRNRPCGYYCNPENDEDCSGPVVPARAIGFAYQLAQQVRCTIASVSRGCCFSSSIALAVAILSRVIGQTPQRILAAPIGITYPQEVSLCS